MKKILSVLLIGALCFAFTSCGSVAKEPAVSEVMAKITSSVEFPEMAEIPKEDLGVYYEIDTTVIDEMAYVIAGSGVDADEVLILKLKTEQDVNKVFKIVDEKRQSQTELFESYAPAEATKIENAFVLKKGNYYIYAVTSDTKKVEDAVLPLF